MAALDLELHKLTKDSPDCADILARILTLSNIIFAADPQSKYASLAVWHARLAQPSSLILYLTAAGQDPKEPVAFLFAHARTHDPALQTGEAESLHIWLAGVSPEIRKGGCLGKMMDELKGSSHQCLTVCTTPSMYPDMWNWLLKQDWVVDRMLEGEKVLLRSAHSTVIQTGQFLSSSLAD